jgi:F-type H+-transporting ATPase subunit a
MIRNSMSSLLHIEGIQPQLQPDIFGHVLGAPISNVWTTTWLLIGIFALLMIGLRKLALVPGRGQAMFEMGVEMFEELIFQISGSKKTARRLLFVTGPLLLFLLLSNLISIVPGLSSLTYAGLPLFRTATNDYNMTLTLGIVVSLFINGMIIKQVGIFSFVGKFVQIKPFILSFTKGPMAVFESLIGLFIGFMDIIGEIAKILSMTLRLFGNIYAGEVMTVVFYSLFSLLAPFPWHGLSAFSGIIQALVFTLLTIVFYSMGVTPEEA